MSSALAEIPAPSLKCAGPSSPSFLRSSLIFGSVSFATYLLSLVKTVIVSRYFGTSAEMDAFTIAVLVPNLLGALIAGSASAGLVPALAVAEREGAQLRADTYRTSFVLFMAGCTVASVALAIFGKQLVHLVAPAFTGDRLAIAERLAPGASLILLFNGVYAFSSAELLSRKKYVLVAAAPAITTLLSLLGIMAFRSRGAAVLVWALAAGLAVQALVVFFPTWAACSGGRCTRWRNPSVTRVLSAQWVLLAVSSIGVTNSFIDQVISTLLPPGNVSALSYASSLNCVSMQVIVMSMGWIALPNLSELAAAHDLTGLRRQMRTCVITTVMIAAPACLLIVGLGETSIRVFFQHGRFDANSTRLVYLTWAGYSLGLVPAAIGMMAVRVANALHENWLLFRVGMALLAVNAILDYALMRVAGVMGITLSTSFVYCISSVLLYRALRAHVGELLDNETLRHILKVAGAVAVAAIPAAIIRVLAPPGFMISAAQFGVFVVGLVLAYQRAGVIACCIRGQDWRAWRWVHVCVKESC